MLSPLPTAAVSATSVPDIGERELKFTLSEGRVDLARRRLDGICRRDSKFPEAIVWTIYYDTAGLASLGEKINSDYLKRKIRVRWYSDLSGRATGPAFVEAKLRVGNRRSKVRAQLPYPAEELARWDLQDPRFQTFPALLREHGIVLHDRWQPVMLLRYRRDRFFEPASRSRVSLDSEIAAAAVNHSVFSVFDSSTAGAAVLEVKGAGEKLPLALRSLLQLGLHKRSFSKFLVVYARMTRQLL
jgi:VTC domain